MTVVFGNWRRTAISIFALALLLRGAFILTQQDGFYFFDSLLYSQAATNLVSTGGYGANYDRAPGYPAFVAAVYLLFGQSILAIRAVESVIGAFLAVMIAVLAKRMAGDIIGAMAGAIWAVYPMGIFIAGLVYPTNCGAVLLASGVYWMLPSSQAEFSARRVFYGGLFFGLAALTVPVALLTIVVVAAWIFYWARHARVFFALLFLFVSALTVAPWTVREFIVHQRVVPVQSDFERYLPQTTTPERDTRDGSINAFVLRVELYATHFGRNFVDFWELYPKWISMGDQAIRNKLHARDSLIIKETIYTPNRLINAVSILSEGPIFLFGFLGTAMMWLRRDMRRELSMLWTVVISFAVGYAFFVGKIRYRIPVEPYLIILAAYGLHATYAMMSARFIPVLRSSRFIIWRRFNEMAESFRRRCL